MAIDFTSHLFEKQFTAAQKELQAKMKDLADTFDRMVAENDIGGLTAMLMSLTGFIDTTHKVLTKAGLNEKIHSAAVANKELWKLKK